MKLGITRTLPGLTRDQFEPAFEDVLGPFDGRIDERDLGGLASRVDVLMLTLRDRVTADVLAMAPNLKLIVTFSVGVDHIDVEAAKQQGVRLSHTPSVLTDATADLAFSLLLGCCRRLKPGLRLMEEGQFQGFEPELFLGRALRGRALGIVGMGKIGTAMAKRALGFGMEILYCGSEKSLGFDARHLELMALLKEAAIVSLHCPLTESNRHLIGRRELSVMAEDGILINTARGALVDEGALLAHLRTHPDFYAGLDVYEQEPEVTEGLAGLPNALCLPHLGSATREARLAMAEVNRDEAVRFATGQPLQYEM